MLRVSDALRLRCLASLMFRVSTPNRRDAMPRVSDVSRL